MSDPFASNSRSQLLREAQIGLSLVAVLLVLFVYVAYYRITGQGSQIPSNVHSAPVAQTVWPYENSPELVSTQSAPIAAVIPKPQAVIKQPALVANDFSLPAPPVKTPSLNKNRSEVSVASHVEPRMTTGQPSGTTAIHSRNRNEFQALSPANKPLANQPRDVESPAIKKAQAVDTDRIASKVLAIAPKKLVAQNADSSTRSQVVDDPFETNSKPIGQPNVVVKENSIPQIGSTNVSKAGSFDKSNNSFSPLLTSNSAGDEPCMDCPKPLVQNIPETELADTKSNASSIHVNQLRSVSGPAELDAARQPLQNANDFATAKPAAKSEPVSDLRAESSSFDTQASFYENLSQSIPEPDLLTSPQEISQTNPSRQTIAKQEMGNESGTLLQPPKARSEEVPTVYQVQPGDSFWTIAQLRYGDGRFFRALYLYNERNVIGFDDLPPGTRIDTPSQQVLMRLWPEHCPASKPQSIATKDFTYHVTQNGDTLFGIAAQRLGQASRYLEILELNSQRLPNGVNHLTPLKAGIHVLLPAEELN